MLNDKFYEVIEDGDCADCVFDKDVHKCALACDFCSSDGCGFRYSQELTDRLNRRSHIQEPREDHITKISKNDKQ